MFINKSFIDNFYIKFSAIGSTIPPFPQFICLHFFNLKIFFKVVHVLTETKEYFKY